MSCRCRMIRGETQAIRFRGGMLSFENMPPGAFMAALERTPVAPAVDNMAASTTLIDGKPAANLAASDGEPCPPSSEPWQASVARIVDAREMRALEPLWRDLFHRCAQANPFYGPDFLLPLLDLDGKIARTRFVIVEARCGARMGLAALCPITATGLGIPGLRRSIGTPRHPYIFNQLPLLRAGFEATLWRQMLDALETAFGRGLLLIPASPLDSPVAKGLREALAASERASLVVVRGERAAIIARGDAEAHLARVKARTLAKIRRHEGELRKLGRLDFVSATSGSRLAQAVEAFIALEASGWKGRQGTAFASDPRSLAFARQALSSARDAPGVRVDYLTLEGKPIGACLHLTAAGYSATFKTAHDEAFAKHAPGVLSMVFSRQSLFGEHWTECLDSGAPPEHAVGAVWPDRIPVADMLGALSPRQGRHELQFYARSQALVDGARAKVRQAYYMLTGRKRTRARKG
jgi:Acetyltransferase (GNAT) domain